MSDYNKSIHIRERTNTAKEPDRQATKSSPYTPKVTIEVLSRNVPSNIKSKNQKINNADHPVTVLIYYSTISVASACIILTAVFSVCIYFLSKIIGDRLCISVDLDNVWLVIIVLYEQTP
jgi:hypothetical protein